MRVAHFFYDIRVGGGVPHSVISLTKLLAQQGHMPTIWCTDRSEPAAHWASELPETAAVEILETMRSKRGLIHRASAERFRASLEDTDVLHLHGLWRPANAQLARLAERLDKPYVVSPHGMLDPWPMSQRGIRKRIYYRLVEGRTLDRAARVHVTAELEAKYVGAWIRHRRLSVVPCAVDLEPYREPPESSLFLDRHPEIDRHTPTVLFVGRLHVKKSPDLLIDAVQSLRREGVACQLVLAGDGAPAYLRALRARAERGDGIHFVGLVRGLEKVALYAHADVFALPTHHENFGLVYAESLACGTPVVTTRNTDSWPDLESGGGALIVDRSLEAIAGAIRRLLASPRDRLSMGERGRRWVFDWLHPVKLAGLYESLYREAVG